jgi:hypothetical protein
MCVVLASNTPNPSLMRFPYCGANSMSSGISATHQPTYRQGAQLHQDQMGTVWTNSDAMRATLPTQRTRTTLVISGFRQIRHE